MKYTLLFILSIVSVSAFGQDYHLFSYKGYPLYELINGHPDHNEIYSFATKNTIVNAQGDTIIYHKLLSNGLTKHWNYQWGHECETVRDSSFFGNATVIKPDFSFIFYNRKGETVTIKPQSVVGDTWIVYTFEDSSYVEANLLNVDLRNVYGTMDSVKSIRFLVKDTNHVVKSHPLNHHQMTISQHFGMLKGLNFLYFPEVSSYLELVGHPSLNTSIYQPKWLNIYDFEIGDIFHIQEGIPPGPGNWLMHYDEWNVLSKNVTSTEYIYTIDKKRASLSYLNDTIYSRDTLTVIYPLTHYSDTIQSFELYQSNVLNYWATVYSNDYNGRMTKFYDRFEGGLQPDSCMGYTLGMPYPTLYHIEGVGGPYFSGTTIGAESRLLRYYKKGAETWGTPYDFDLLSDTKSVIPTVEKLQITPNPATNNIIISSDAIIKNGQLTVFDMAGKVIHQVVLAGKNEVNLSIQNWINGVYLVKIVDKNRVWSGKLVKN
ncbi:MAG: T9SS type A sorting domain-containing protein [Saprospiraceae bacterium]